MTVDIEFRPINRIVRPCIPRLAGRNRGDYDPSPVRRCSPGSFVACPGALRRCAARRSRRRPGMKVYDAAAIRNVALVGHGGSGKTQLVSAMLFAAGAVNRLGRVDDGTTTTDFDEEEIARKHTLSSSLAHAEWQKNKINIIDTPGIRQLPLRRPRRAPRRRGGPRRGRCCPRRRSADREALVRSRRARTCRASSCSTGSIANAPASSAPRHAAPRLRPRDRPHPDPARRGKGVYRRRRPRAHEGADVRLRQQRKADRRRDSRLARRAAHRRPASS